MSDVANLYPVEITKDGKKYEGTYKVWAELVYVTYGDRTMTTHIGGSPSDTVARMLLREMVEARP